MYEKLLKTLKKNILTDELKEVIKEDVQTNLQVPKTLTTIVQGLGKTLDDLNITISKKISIHVGESEYA